MQWSAHIPTGFHVPRRTLEPARLPLVVVYGTLTLYGLPSQIVRLTIDNAITQARTLREGSLGSSAFARRYLRNRLNLSFPLGTKMFQFPRCSSTPNNSEGDWQLTSRVSPFGHRRIKAHIQLPAAYRR